MYANSEDFQVLAITTMVSSFVAEWNDQNMKLHHKKGGLHKSIFPAVQQGYWLRGTVLCWWATCSSIICDSIVQLSKR